MDFIYMRTFLLVFFSSCKFKLSFDATHKHLIEIEFLYCFFFGLFVCVYFNFFSVCELNMMPGNCFYTYVSLHIHIYVIIYVCKMFFHRIFYKYF